MKKRVMLLLVMFALASPVCAEYSGEIQVETLARAEQSWDGQLLTAYPTTQPEITVLRIQVPPGSQLPRHKHPLINAGFLVSGELTVIKDTGEILHLKAGDAIIEVVDTWHYGKNEGTIPADIVVMYVGTPGAELSEK